MTHSSNANWNSSAEPKTGFTGEEYKIAADGPSDAEVVARTLRSVGYEPEEPRGSNPGDKLFDHPDRAAHELERHLAA